MRYAILSDVHANLEALEAVLRDMQRHRADKTLFLGDAVGYGPDPNECVELLKRNCDVLLAGNHDLAAIGRTPFENFNEYARAAVLWTRTVLTEKSRELLGGLPTEHKLKKEQILLVHATPKEPEAWHYLLTLWDAEMNFHYFEERLCLLGHSHQPFIIERLPSGEMLTYRDRATIGKSKRYIINAGSVGQPRDRDSRASYLILDDEKAEFFRVAYDLRKTQEKMAAAGLPMPLIERLSRGT